MIDDERRRRNRKSRGDYLQRIESAKRVLRFALTQSLHPDMQRRLLKEVLWAATEARFHKHKLSLRTPDADREILKSEPKLGSRVRHEHVYQRRWVIAQILTEPDRADELLEKFAVACVVTVDEAKRLEEHDHLVGWQRYSAANLSVLEVLDDGTVQPYPIHA